MIEKVLQCEGDAGGKNVLFHLPKHIMQIGSGGGVPEIYIEDYAYGYLGRLAANDCTVCRVAVLVGEFIRSEGKRYVFIRGAIEAEDATEENKPKFSSEIWADVYGKIKRFFPQYEAVGWFFGGPGYLTEVNDTVRQTHLDWFGGRDRVLFRLDPVEKESSFYLYDNGEMVRWPGYCVYYEKNEEMQDFLVAGKPQSVDVGYTEPVLVRMSRCLGRKTDAAEDAEASTEKIVPKAEVTSEKTRTEAEVPMEGNGVRAENGAKVLHPEPEKAGRDVPQEAHQGRFGTGMVAAAALMVVAAVAIRYTQNRTGPAAAPTVGLIPTPSGGQYLEETSARPTDTPVKPIVISQDGESFFGGDFENQFHPAEEPEIPTKQILPTKKITASPVPAKKPTTKPTPTRKPEPTKVPTKKPTPEPTASPKPTKSAETGTLPGMLYVVKSGDTLAAICRKFYGDVSRMEEVKEVNQIADENKIYAGQELYLP